MSCVFMIAREQTSEPASIFRTNGTRPPSMHLPNNPIMWPSRVPCASNHEHETIRLEIAPETHAQRFKFSHSLNFTIGEFFCFVFWLATRQPTG